MEKGNAAGLTGAPAGTVVGVASAVTGAAEGPGLIERTTTVISSAGESAAERLSGKAMDMAAEAAIDDVRARIARDDSSVQHPDAQAADGDNPA